MKGCRLQLATIFALFACHSDLVVLSQVSGKAKGIENVKCAVLHR